MKSEPRRSIDETIVSLGRMIDRLVGAGCPIAAYRILSSRVPREEKEHARDNGAGQTTGLNYRVNNDRSVRSNRQDCPSLMSTSPINRHRSARFLIVHRYAINNLARPSFRTPPDLSRPSPPPPPLVCLSISGFPCVSMGLLRGPVPTSDVSQSSLTRSRRAIFTWVIGAESNRLLLRLC